MRKNEIIMFYLALFIGAKAGTVTEFIDYQNYRDFAMNKGKFKVGATNIRVDRKDGTYRTINVPIPDFSSTDSIGVGTLVNSNYIVGVKHNGSYKNVSYGYGMGHTYKLIDRNNHESQDFHAPRLNKVVTDVAPSNWNSLEGNTIDWAQNKGKYSIFARVGSGTQNTITQNPNGTFSQNNLSGAYKYLTGGFYSPEALFGGNLSFRAHGDKLFLNHNINTALPIFVEAGDSGSPLWGFNSTTKEWELLGVARAITAWDDIFTSFQKDFTLDMIKEDTSPDIVNKNSQEEILWYGINGLDNKGIGELTQGENKWEYHGLKGSMELNKASEQELNSTKHLTFKGQDGILKLQDNINMGAGKLTFESNYTVTSENKDKTWIGAGIDILKEKEVLWQVNGVKDDNLHKIGQGTLIVNGKGVNEGGLNVGDGVVILSQEVDETGKLQAFNNIDIVSGRSTVVLSDDKQIDTSKIKFMFRGGRLDLNGNKISFGDINAVDNGAKIINGSENKAIASINTDKFKGNTSIFHGFFGESDENKKNGKLDIKLEGTGTILKTFAVTGGSNLDGDIDVTRKNTKLIFSGGRDLHAGENIKSTTVNGDYYFSKFKFNNLNLSENTSFVGSVYSIIEGNINTTGNSNLILGYIDGMSDLVYDSTQDTLTQTAVATKLNSKISGNRFEDINTFYKGNININNGSELLIGFTRVEGDINLANNSYLSMENSDFIGNIDLKKGSDAYIGYSNIAGNIINDKTSSVELDNTTWALTSDSAMKSLKLNNSVLDFKDDAILSVDNILGSSSAIFNMNSDTGENNKLIVAESVEKNTKLNIDIRNQGENLVLGQEFKIISLPKDNIENIEIKSLENMDYIDIGAIRANLNIKDNSVVASIPSSEVQEITNQIEYMSNLTNAGVSEFTARVNLIKNQRLLIHDRLNNLDGDMEKAGIYYLGNYSDMTYRSKNYRSYEQKITSNGIGYDKKIYSNNNSDIYLGTSFNYGHSNIDLIGEYASDMTSYTLQLYSKVLTNKGYFVAGDVSTSLIRSKLTSYSNQNKVNNMVNTLGVSFGRIFDYNTFKIIPSFTTSIYDISKQTYKLTDRFKDSYEVKSKKDIFIEFKPEVKIEKDLYLFNKKLTTYIGVDYEINKYLTSNNPKINVQNIEFIAPIVKKGMDTKLGTYFEVTENLNIGLEARYFSGEEIKKKLSGNLKLNYKF